MIGILILCVVVGCACGISLGGLRDAGLLEMTAFGLERLLSKDAVVHRELLGVSED